MSANFSGEPLRLPPGVGTSASIPSDTPQPAWLSPVANPRLKGLGSSEGHLVVGGRTVWVESGAAPAAIVASFPNRLGSDEDLAHMADLAQRWAVPGLVEIDPLIGVHITLPGPLVPLVAWTETDRAALIAAGSRARQAAEALRRRLVQVRGAWFPVEHPIGRTVAVVLPVPADPVVEALGEQGAVVDRIESWEGGLSMTLGWWHTRPQIDALAAAVSALVSGGPAAPVPADSFDRVHDDLPLRHLDTIPFS